MRALIGCVVAIASCEPVGPRPTGVVATGPAAVVAVTPANGANSVRADVVLQLVFGAPMDHASTERSFHWDPDLPSTFAWDASSTAVAVTPVAAFAYAEAVDEATPALRYAYRIGADATTADGRPLAPFEGSFTTMRRKRMRLLSDGGLDGYVRQDGRIDTCEEDVPWGAVCVGEAGSEVNAYLQYKGFLAFALAGLPPEPVEIEAAHVVAHQYAVGNKPYEELGVVRLEHMVDVPFLDEAAFRAGGEPVDRAFSTTPELGMKRSANVADALAADRAAGRPYAQFRLVFSAHRETGMTYPLTAKFYPGRVREEGPDEATRAKHPWLDVAYLVP